MRGGEMRERYRGLGFTLIEVLAALIIVSLGMLGVIQAVGQTASNSGYLRDKTIAHWIAMNRITELRVQPQPPKIDKASDEIEMAGRRWRWTTEVTQTAVESVRRIDVSVRAAEADEHSALARVTGFYGTAIAPAGSTLVSWPGAANPGQDAGEGGDKKKNPPNPPRPTPPGRGGELIDPPTPEPIPEPQP
jgi:general secretion pathway protein I